MHATQNAGIFESLSTPDQGDANLPDYFDFEFYGSSVGAGLNGEATGTFDLSQSGDDQYSTCSRCVLVYDDNNSADGGMGKIFMAQSGTLVLDSTSDQTNGTVSGSISNVTLVEVTLAGSPSFTSTPVAGGECRHIASAPLATPVAPSSWTCNPTFYGDGSCDCGCGAVDVDCADASVASCQYCNGGCSTTACPGTINPTNNAVCGP